MPCLQLSTRSVGRQQMNLEPTVSILLAVPLITAAIWLGLLVHSLLFPNLRVWPVPVPAQRAVLLRTRLNRSAGLATGLSALCLFLLGLADFGSLQLALSVHIGLGAALFLSVQLRGPYRISRNPQYVGTIGVLVGFGLMTELGSLSRRMPRVVPLVRYRTIR